MKAADRQSHGVSALPGLVAAGFGWFMVSAMLTFVLGYDSITSMYSDIFSHLICALTR